MASPAQSTSTHRAAISRPSSTYGRKRAVKACQVCRARRTKCDQMRPSCSFCVKAGVQCVFEPDPPHATFDQASLAIIDRLDRLERKIDAQSTSRKGQEGSGATDGISLGRSQSAMLSRGQLFPENLDGLLKWPVFRDIASPSATATASSPYSSARSHSQPYNQQTAWLGDDLDPPTCDRWLDNFFAHVHVKNPILDEVETRRLVRKLCVQGAGWDITSGLALLVCANGAIARPLHEALPRSDSDIQMAVALFNAAQRRLGSGLVSLGLIQAQCAFLSGVLLMSLLRPVEAWTTFVHGLAICQTFPSIRRLKPETEHITAETVSEQSIFWSCWKSEQELRFELGMPGSIGLADDPPELFPDPPEGCQGHVERAWYFYLSEISLWRLEVNARRSIDQLQHEDWASLSQALNELTYNTLGQLDAWRDSLPPLVNIGGSEISNKDDDVARFVLRGRVTYVHELISWPFLFDAINNGPYHPDVEQQVANVLAFHHGRLLANTPGYYHRHHGTWLMLRSSARSACLLLIFACLYPGSGIMPPNWKDSISETVTMVEYWGAEVEEMRPVLETMTHLVESLQR